MAKRTKNDAGEYIDGGEAELPPSNEGGRKGRKKKSEDGGSKGGSKVLDKKFKSLSPDWIAEVDKLSEKELAERMVTSEESLQSAERRMKDDGDLAAARAEVKHLAEPYVTAKKAAKAELGYLLYRINLLRNPPEDDEEVAADVAGEATTMSGPAAVVPDTAGSSTLGADLMP